MGAEIIGIVRERSNPDLAKRHELPRKSIGFLDLAKTIGDADPVQLTATVDELAVDPAAIDLMSYTFLAPRSLAGKNIVKSAVVSAVLVPVETPGRDQSVAGHQKPSGCTNRGGGTEWQIHYFSLERSSDTPDSVWAELPRRMIQAG